MEGALSVSGLVTLSSTPSDTLIEEIELLKGMTGLLRESDLGKDWLMKRYMRRVAAVKHRLEAFPHLADYVGLITSLLRGTVAQAAPETSAGPLLARDARFR